jgi:hypothetical protein
VHGKQTMILNRLGLSIFCVDYFSQKNLIVSVELSQILLGAVISRNFVTLIDETHVLADGMIDFGFLVDYALDSLEISVVAIFLVESGS